MLGRWSELTWRFFARGPGARNWMLDPRMPLLGRSIRFRSSSGDFRGLVVNLFPYIALKSPKSFHSWIVYLSFTTEHLLVPSFQLPM